MHTAKTAATMPSMTDDTEAALAALGAIAEDPLVAPSKRVEARKALRAYRDAVAEAEGAARAARRLRAAITSGRPLTWREIAAARAMGLLVEDE